MLGVQRTTVTLVAGRLETLGALTCRRGYMDIRSRAALERHSCECYKNVQSYMGALFATANERRKAIGAARREQAGGAAQENA
jgi:hypothetical protein